MTGPPPPPLHAIRLTSEMSNEPNVTPPLAVMITLMLVISPGFPVSTTDPDPLGGEAVACTDVSEKPAESRLTARVVFTACDTWIAPIEERIKRPSTNNPTTDKAEDVFTDNS